MNEQHFQHQRRGQGGVQVGEEEARLPGVVVDVNVLCSV